MAEGCFGSIVAQVYQPAGGIIFAMNVYALKAVLVLPFRSWLPESPFRASWCFGGDDWNTEITLYHSQFFLIPVAPGRVDTSLSTITEISTGLPFQDDREVAKKWAMNHSADIIADRILPRLNDFLLRVKHAYPNPLQTGTMRSLGDIDLLFSRLFFEGEIIAARSGSAFLSFLGITVPPALLPGQNLTTGRGIADAVLSREPSKEWVAITRAVDLVNHGYFPEALVVGFALLDALAEEFVKGRLPNLAPKDADALVATIAHDRLKTFLGPLMRLCLGESPLDDKETEGDLVWLNRKRNAIVHRGDSCSRKESQRGLTVAWRLLMYLSENGASYSLPSRLEFWTVTDATQGS